MFASHFKSCLYISWCYFWWNTLPFYSQFYCLSIKFHDIRCKFISGIAYQLVDSISYPCWASIFSYTPFSSFGPFSTCSYCNSRPNRCSPARLLPYNYIWLGTRLITDSRLLTNSCWVFYFGSPFAQSALCHFTPGFAFSSHDYSFQESHLQA